MYPPGSTVVANFTGGTGPLNRQLATWLTQGWHSVSVTRQGGSRWDIVLKCGE